MEGGGGGDCGSVLEEARLARQAAASGRRSAAASGTPAASDIFATCPLRLFALGACAVTAARRCSAMGLWVQASSAGFGGFRSCRPFRGHFRECWRVQAGDGATAIFEWGRYGPFRSESTRGDHGGVGSNGGQTARVIAAGQNLGEARNVVPRLRGRALSVSHRKPKQPVRRGSG